MKLRLNEIRKYRERGDRVHAISFIAECSYYCILCFMWGMDIEMKCNICPRKCNTERITNKGFCGMGNQPVVAKACLHMWEEPCISGASGSGAVFFSGCNLKCVYCQNFKISQENVGKEIDTKKLAKIFLDLQQKGANNINLVNPTHFILNIRETLLNIQNLKIPMVYNTNSYESVKGLKLMEGLVDIYLPDLKYFSSDISLKYSFTEDYFSIASRAILEMYRQVGEPSFNNTGIMQKGMIIRHLILPGLTGESIKVLDWIKANLPEDILVSIMSQYTPYYMTDCYPEINRRITRHEYEKVVNHFYKRGFKNGYIQERDSAEEEYIPEFNLEGV